MAVEERVGMLDEEPVGMDPLPDGTEVRDYIWCGGLRIALRKDPKGGGGRA